MSRDAPWPFGRLKTPEERYEEIEQLADFNQRYVIHPIWLLIRWPWWPLYLDIRGRHHASSEYGLGGTMLFPNFCLVAIFFQLGFVLSLAWKLLAPADTSSTMVILMGAAYAASTIMRIVLYFRNEWHGS